MDLDPRFLQVVILVVVVFVAIARLFYRVFVKPFVPPSQPGSGLPPVRRAPRQHEIKDFLEELRRDLGHGEPPAPRRGDGLMDEERPVEAGYLDSRDEEPSRQPETATLGIPRPFHPQPPHPSPPVHPAAEALDRAARQEEAARRRAAARREAIARAEKAAALLEQRAAEEQAAAVVVTPTQEGHFLSAPGAGSADSSRDNVLGVDLERAVILQQILGPPHCRQPRRPRFPPPAPPTGRR